MKINKKLLAKLQIVDIAYIVFGAIFSLVTLIELVKYLIAEYSFQRASIVFAVVTVLYIAVKKNIFGSSQQNTQKTKTFKDSLLVAVTGTRRRAVKKQVFSWLGTEYVYLAFLAYAVFAGVYMFYDIPENIFFYVSLAFVLYYIGARYTGTKIDMSLPETPFSQSTFLKLIVLSFSLFFILLFSLFGKEQFGENYIVIYLLIALIYLCGFTFLFSCIFQNLSQKLRSRSFKIWMVSHTYFLLSGAIFLISFLLIAGKMGLFDTILIQKVIPATYAPTEIQQETIEPSYQEVSEIRPLIEFYDVQAPLALGASGEQVEILQQALTLVGNYTQDITGEFDEYTRITLRDVLIEKCDWPESTQGIVGPQAKDCLDNIEVERKIRIDTSGFEGDIISDEVTPQ